MSPLEQPGSEKLRIGPQTPRKLPAEPGAPPDSSSRALPPFPGGKRSSKPSQEGWTTSHLSFKNYIDYSFLVHYKRNACSM